MRVDGVARVNVDLAKSRFDMVAFNLISVTDVNEVII